MDPDEDDLGVSLYHERLYSGPIPSAEQLASIDDVVPGMAEKLLDSHLEDQRSLREIRERMSRLPERGQLIAGGLGLLLVVAGVVAIVFSATAVAITIFGTTIIGVIASFYVASRNNDDD